MDQRIPRPASSRNACALPPASGVRRLGRALEGAVNFGGGKVAVRRQSKQLAAAFVRRQRLHLTPRLPTAAWSACAKPPGRCRAAASRSSPALRSRHLADALRRLGMACIDASRNVGFSPLAAIPATSRAVSRQSGRGDQHRSTGKLPVIQRLIHGIRGAAPAGKEWIRR